MISVIIPVYNVELYLRDCLESVIKQDYDDYEVICVNDGSTDGSLLILEEYAQRYPFIFVYSKENGGLSSARNYGLEKAKGKYIYFLDSDDMFFDTECLSFMAGNMEKEDLDVLYFDGKSFFEDTQKSNENLLQMYQRKCSYGVYETGQELFAIMVKGREYYSSVCLKCYRSEYLKKNHLFFVDKLLHEDEIFTFKEMLLAGKVMHIRRKVLARRIRQGSIMQTKPKFQNFYSLVVVYKQMYEFCHKKQFSVNIEGAITDVMENICKSAQNKFYRMDKEEREKINELPLYEQKLINAVFLNGSDKISNEYRFPYHLFSENDRVVIYGAGNVGRKIYYQAFYDDVINIVGIVDSNAHEMGTEEIPIEPLSFLDEWEYDYVLIAVKNQDIASEIKENLMSRGIPKGKIKWGEKIFENLNCIGQVRQYDKFIRSQMEGRKRQLYLFMLPEHGNMGDYAIGYAERKFFANYFSEYNLICVTTNEWMGLKETLKKIVRKEDVIFISGGGYFGDIWTSGAVSKEIVEAFPDNKKIYMPNNLTYKNGNWEENEIVRKDMCWLVEQKNTYMCFREKKSYEYVKRFAINCIYVPDIALYLHFPKQDKIKGEKVLLCLRSDCEKTFVNQNELFNVLDEKGCVHDEFDINLQKYVSQEDGVRYLEELVFKIQSYDLVITDRLHGMILATISEVPCIAFDNLTHKVSGVYEWIKNRSTVVMMSDENMDKLPVHIEELLAMDKENYCVNVAEFDRMAEFIKNIIQ